MPHNQVLNAPSPVKMLQGKLSNAAEPVRGYFKVSYEAPASSTLF